MPLFMDRHEIQGTGAKALADAHQMDLAVQGKHCCRALTYWFDESRGTAFCLIEAPSAAAVREMHADAHGIIPNHVVEVDGAAVAQFLGRIADPEKAQEKPIQESAFRALLFVDMVGSTDITRALGDLAALPLARRYRGIVRSALLEHGGREVDRAGDGFLTSFESAYAAVKCAIAIQRALAQEAAIRDDGVAVQARIGIGAGEPVLDGDALFGSTVNLTSRICGHAGPGEIMAARVVRDLCFGKPARFASVGQVALKGFDEDVALERIEWAA